MPTTEFETVVTEAGRGRSGIAVPVPFDPDQVWGAKPVHHVAGTVNGRRMRAAIEAVGDGFRLTLGPTWCRDNGVGPGDPVSVRLEPEGPQRDELAPDLAEALAADPAAGAFFDSLAQFYRKAYLTWIDATRRRPEVRAERIAVVVQLLAAGIKERPR